MNIFSRKTIKVINSIRHIKNQSFGTQTKSFSIMADQNGLQLHNVINALNNFAPQILAASWDNVGLLIEPATARFITHILLTNDLTEDVMQEAIQINADLVVSYHPPLFAPIKSVTQSNWKERIVASCLENRIAVFSPHTCWDSVRNGVNDWLANSFDVKQTQPILPGVLPNTGEGRFCNLNNGITLNKAIALVKDRVKVDHIRLALARNKSMDSIIQTVAVCAGSGSSVLKGVRADLYLTGEMLHHDILEAAQTGTNVILCNHSDSERGFLHEFKPKLVKMLKNQVSVTVALKDKDPLQTV